MMSAGGKKYFFKKASAHHSGVRKASGGITALADILFHKTPLKLPHKGQQSSPKTADGALTFSA